jgi:hypothetical protein
MTSASHLDFHPLADLLTSEVASPQLLEQQLDHELIPRLTFLSWISSWTFGRPPQEAFCCRYARLQAHL